MPVKPRQRKLKPKLFDEYARVSEHVPCPVCGRPDWCLVHKSGRKCICSRVQSGMPRGQAGWLHYTGGLSVPHGMTHKQGDYLTTGQVQEYLTRITEGRNASMIERLGREMGLSLDSLIMMQVTYDQDQAVAVFPMFDAQRHPIGCRFRRNDGRKWSLRGGREGVFMSREFSLFRPLWIAEGATDTAAIVQLGFTNVIGRPNCSGGVEIIKSLLKNRRAIPVIIVADPDEPGIEGARDLAAMLPNPTIVVAGPCDIRDFVAKRLAKDARHAILEGIDGDELTTWRPVYRNRLGQFYDFVESLQRKAA